MYMMYAFISIFFKSWCMKAEQMYLMCNDILFVYRTIAEEKDFLEMTTTEERCVVHFYHEDFRRCSIMDTHLEVL